MSRLLLFLQTLLLLVIVIWASSATHQVSSQPLPLPGPAPSSTTGLVFVNFPENGGNYHTFSSRQ